MDTEEEPFAWFYSNGKQLYFMQDKTEAASRGYVPLYTHPQSNELRKVAEEYLEYMDREEADIDLEQLFAFINLHTKNLRAALEGK